MSFYLIAAFGGPIVGPLSGSFMAQETTYRWIFWALTIMAGASFIAGSSRSLFHPPVSLADSGCIGACVPETYAPVRLSGMAKDLSETTENVYRSALAPARVVPITTMLRSSLVRPFQMLFREGIVAFFALYTGFICELDGRSTTMLLDLLIMHIDGLLYGFFGAFPWRVFMRVSFRSLELNLMTLGCRIYHHERGWSTGIASLPFIAVGLGMLVAVLTNLRFNKSYIVKTRAHEGPLPPEERLVLCCAGGVVLPVGLMVFAFTARPSVHWVVPVGAGGLFGFGFVGIFLSMTVRLSLRLFDQFVDHKLMTCATVVSTGYVRPVRCFGAGVYGFREIACGRGVSAVHTETTRGNVHSGKPFSTLATPFYTALNGRGPAVVYVSVRVPCVRGGASAVRASTLWCPDSGKVALCGLGSRIMSLLEYDHACIRRSRTLRSFRLGSQVRESSTMPRCANEVPVRGAHTAW